MEYEITDTITPQEYLEMRTIVGWKLFPLEQAKDGLEHTTHIVCFRKDKKPIAVARVLWDHGYVIYIADVIVHPDFQGQGIGRDLMNHALDYIKSKLKPGWRIMVNLQAAKGKEGFYKKFGFIERPNPDFGPGMHQWLEIEQQ